MAIELIEPGASAAELFAKINEIIAALNDISPATSYEELTDKPSVNGVTLSGNKSTSDLKVKIAETQDIDTYTETWATKTEMNAMQTAAVNAASEAAATALAGKMDKDMSNVESVAYLGDEGYIPVVVDGGVKKMTVKNMADYYEVKRKATDADSDPSIVKERKSLELTGEQDGANTDFDVESGFVLGTSALYLNGQLLTRNLDYTETSAYQIKMLTHIPVEEDILILMAIPRTTE